MINKITCVISCYNEEENLPKLIDEIKQYDLNKCFNFIIVNNGSLDNSFLVLENIKKKNKLKNIKFLNLNKNLGWGNGILEGLKRSDTSIVGWTHGDLEYSLSALLEINKIISKKKLFDDKNFFIKGKRINRQFGKYLMSKLMSYICSIILMQKMSDINAQPFFFHVSHYKKWTKPPKDLALDMFAYYKILKVNKCCEIRFNVEQTNRIHGSSSWNINFFSKFKLAYNFLKSAIKIKKCHYL